MAFNIKNLISTAIKDIGIGINFANKYGLTSLIPGGSIAATALNFIGNLNNAIVGAEATIKGGDNKKSAVKLAIDAGFAAYQDVAEMRGEVFTYDAALEDQLIEAQLVALDLAAKFRATWKFTPKAS